MIQIIDNCRQLSIYIFHFPIGNDHFNFQTYIQISSKLKIFYRRIKSLILKFVSTKGNVKNEFN